MDPVVTLPLLLPSAALTGHPFCRGLEVATPPPHPSQLSPRIGEPLANATDSLRRRCLSPRCYPLFLKKRGVFHTPGWVELTQLNPAKPNCQRLADVATPVSNLPLIQRP